MLVLHMLQPLWWREDTWDRAGTSGDILPNANEMGMVRKNRGHAFVLRFPPVSTWAPGRRFFKTFQVLYNGLLGLTWERRFPEELLQKELPLSQWLLGVTALSL